MKASVLTKNQKQTFTKYIDDKRAITCTIRYDDDCGNGHNSFAITGTITDQSIRGRDKTDMCGCIHKEIEKYFPEFKHLIKWHLMSSEAPMHYVANSLYFASNRDCHGKLKGEPYRYQTRMFFNDVPVPVKDYGQKFIELVKSTDAKTLKIVACPHEGSSGWRKTESYKFSDKYTFNDFNTYRDKTVADWYGSPFSSELEAAQILEALINCKITYQTEPTQWGEGKEPDLEAARNVAIWPEATLEDFTKEKLEARLPKLVEEFRTDIEKLGFIF